MARNEQLIRQHRILQILERSRFGKTLEEVRDDLVEELGLSGLSTRSVRRDLDALEASGLDVTNEESQRGRIWKLGPRFRGSHTIQVSATELIALSLGRDLLLPLAGTPFWVGIESFWSTLKATLPESVWEHYEKYRRALFVRGTTAKSYERQHGMLKTLQRAIVEHRVVEIEYQGLGKSAASTRQIEPYGVVYHQPNLYVVADVRDAPPGESPARNLKLDRFRKATLLDAWFTPRRGFDLDEHLRGSLGMFARGTSRPYRVHVSAYAAPWVLENPWQTEQEVETQPDGSIVLTVHAAHDLEVIPRVLALGAEAELLEPAECRAALAATLKKMAKKYGKYP